MDPEQRPIGWWVKRLDTLLDDAVDAVVAGEDLTRGHWQLLHALADGPVQEPEPPAVLADLVARGWVVSAPGGVGLTSDGALAHDRVFRAVGRIQRHVADGLSRQEYERTVLVLRRMAENVERALGRG